MVILMDSREQSEQEQRLVESIDDTAISRQNPQVGIDSTTFSVAVGVACVAYASMMYDLWNDDKGLFVLFGIIPPVGAAVGYAQAGMNRLYR
jgi:hypothetical protein